MYVENRSFLCYFFCSRRVRGDGGVSRVLNDAAAAATALYYIYIYIRVRTANCCTLSIFFIYIYISINIYIQQYNNMIYVHCKCIFCNVTLSHCDHVLNICRVPIFYLYNM